MTEQQKPQQPPLAQARPTVYIDVVVGGQRLSFDVPTAKQLVTEVTAALKAVEPPTKPPPRPSKKRTAKSKKRR